MNEEPSRGFSLERIAFFSDAVFAIAITLLVIDLRVPELVEDASDATLQAALEALLPRVFGYLLSFFVIGLYWLAHWRRFHYIVRSNEGFAAINLLLLGCIAFIPFPTALLGEHGDRAVPVVIYVLSLSAAGIVGTVSWLYAARTGLVIDPLPAPEIRVAGLRGLIVPAVMLSSLVVIPFLGPHVAELLWILILPVHLVFTRLATRFLGVVD
jgi:uncharacterized membrane protein